MNSADTGPMLTCTWSMAGPFVVDETLAVYPDGRVWLWSLHPAHATRRDRIGTFSVDLDASEFEPLAALAAGLAGMVPLEPRWPPDRVTMRVTVQTGGRETSHLLFPGETQMPDLYARALTVLDDLLGRASAHPFAAVRISWEVLDPAVRQGTGATLAFVFRSIGLQPVSLLLEPPTLVLYARVDEGTQEWWRCDTPSPMGILDEEIQLLDGVTAPATIPAGTLGRLVFAGALRPPRAGRFPIIAGVEGAVALAGPQNQDFPGARFRLLSPETPLDVAPAE
jgi:hypothetical protein